MEAKDFDASENIDWFDSSELTLGNFNTEGSSSPDILMDIGMKRFEILLKNFTSKSDKAGKIENLNAHIIRAIQRMFKCMILNRIPKTTCIKIDLKNELQTSYWVELLKLYRTNEELVKEIASKKLTPNPNGKKQGPIMGNVEIEKLKGAHKSFNKNFCQDFFSYPVSQQAFKLVIEIMFSILSEGILCENFNLFCCKSEEHQNNCLSKWIELKEYLNLHYFRALEVPEIESVPTIDLISNLDLKLRNR